MFTYKATITHVVDGDTVDATVDLGFGVFVKRRFRLRDIDTPEIFHPTYKGERLQGKAAKADAVKLLLNKDVILLSGKDQGKYGRWLADITVNDTDFADEMKRLGHTKPRLS